MQFLCSVGLVKEFGFWALDAEMADMGDSPAASSPRSVSISALERVEEPQPSEPAELTRPTRQPSSPPQRWDPFGQSRPRSRGDGATEMEMTDLSAAAKPVAGSASAYLDSSAGSAHASEGVPQPGADTGHIMLAASNAAAAGLHPHLAHKHTRCCTLSHRVQAIPPLGHTAGPPASCCIIRDFGIKTIMLWWSSHA